MPKRGLPLTMDDADAYQQEVWRGHIQILMYSGRKSAIQSNDRKEKDMTYVVYPIPNSRHTFAMIFNRLNRLYSGLIEQEI